jgi:hypothetical protein
VDGCAEAVEVRAGDFPGARSLILDMHETQQKRKWSRYTDVSPAEGDCKPQQFGTVSHQNTRKVICDSIFPNKSVLAASRHIPIFVPAI